MKVSFVLVCRNCAQRFSASSPAPARRCLCGGELHLNREASIAAIQELTPGRSRESCARDIEEALA